jgi:hypothetical protein
MGTAMRAPSHSIELVMPAMTPIRTAFVASVLLAVAEAACSSGRSSSPATSTSPSISNPTVSTVSVSGLVHEPSPTAEVVVPAVRIEVAGGTLTGQVFTSDERGRFELPPVKSGDFYLYFKKPGYDDLRFWVNELPRDEAIDVELIPERPLTQQWNGTLESNYGYGGNGPIRTQIIGWPGDFVFETRRTAAVTLTLETGCGTSGTYTDFVVYVLTEPQGDSVLNLPTNGNGGHGPPFRYFMSRVLPPGHYRLGMWINGFLGHGCPWSLTLSRPY